MSNNEFLLGELKGQVDQIDKRTERMEKLLDSYLIKVSVLAGSMSALTTFIGFFIKSLF